MKRTKLFIGLIVAGALCAGFGPSLSSSAADVTLTYRLPTGQTLSITAPSCGSIPAGGVLVSCSEIPAPPPVQVPSTPLTPPQQEQPSQPSQPSQPPSGDDGGDAGGDD